MPRRHSIVTKLSVAVVAIVTVVIAATGLVNSIISRHYALESARAALRFNSESILRGIGIIENFSRLVVFCGHGSQTENNPLQAGLDCGACGAPNCHALAEDMVQVMIMSGRWGRRSPSSIPSTGSARRAAGP